MSTFRIILFATFIEGLLTQMGIYLKPHINYYHRFFTRMEFLFTWNQWIRLPKPHLFESALPQSQCIMGIMLSLCLCGGFYWTNNEARQFLHFVCKFLSSPSNKQVCSEWMCEQVWICLVDAQLPNDNVLMFEFIHPFFWNNIGWIIYSLIMFR